MEKIICIGSACKDIFFPTDEGIVTETPDDLMSQKKITFELGAKYKIETRFESLGGVAANVASGLSRLGIKCACYSHIGDDAMADWIVQELKKSGVSTELISQEKAFSSDLSTIVVDEKSGDRIIFSNQKANSQMEIIPEKLQNTEWFYIGDLHGNWEEDADKIIKTARGKNIKIANNPRQANIHDNVKKIIEIISCSDVVFLNKDETIEILKGTGQNLSEAKLQNEDFLIKKLRSFGPAIVAMTDGLRGAWGYDGEVLVHSPATGDQSADTTGAGDAFASGFLAAHLKGKNLAESLQWGMANAGNSVKFFGGIAGLLSEKEIMEKIRFFQVKIL
ncbi:MAG: carbohydrate kinase family protein [Patescibacteria group bacterium]